MYSSLPMFQRVGHKAFNNDLTNTIKLCRALDHPEKKFRSIHIAGTNGKGTSAHSIAAILQSAGYKTGLHTSPHLKSFTERIRINGEEIGEQNVIDFVMKYEQLFNEIKPSFFETTVAMAFDHFAREEVDIAVIEVGMGGRFDSTNVITPVLSLITQIGLDHQQYLGSTLKAIASEKAGIIKPEVPVVIGANQPDLFPVFLSKAQELNSPLFQTSDYKIVKKEKDYKKQIVDIQHKQKTLFNNLQLSIIGHYYLSNLPGILENVQRLNELGFDISGEVIRTGLKDVQGLTGLKGRWQVLSLNPLTICDVGHNEDGVSLAMNQLQSIPHKQLHIVWGTVNDKDIKPILSLLPKDARYYFCEAQIPRAFPVDQLASEALKIGLNGYPFRTVSDAINAAKKSANSDDLVFIGGSTFVVAEIIDL